MRMRPTALLATAFFAVALNADAPLPGKGMAQHPFLYCGEWQNRSTSQQTMYIVREGKVVWSYTDRKGRFLYVSNRGHDSIAVFSVNSTTGRLPPIEHVSTLGKTPRNFSLDHTGRYLFAANENSGTVVLFHVDPATGRLTPNGRVLEVPSPSCVVFLEAGSPRP